MPNVLLAEFYKRSNLITIPAHRGTQDLISQVEASEIYIEKWAKEVLTARPFSGRNQAHQFNAVQVANSELGLTNLATVKKSRAAGLKLGLQELSYEELLSLAKIKKLPFGWMRVSVKVFVDGDKTPLYLVIVNDGIRAPDIRTNWGYSQNVFQPHSKAWWKLP